MAWGTYRIPESKLRLLGPLRGRRILELGCGAARWSIALAKHGARPVGIDLSIEQLRRARELKDRSRQRFPIVHGSAERLPFRAGIFDVVFCDFGAMTFANPHATIPEVARVLRRGGSFVFVTSSRWRLTALDVPSDRQVRRLVRPYFGKERVQFGVPSTIEFHPTYSGWIDLFRAHGLRIERLIEPRPTPGLRTTYLSRADVKWGRSWPLEVIWKVVRE